MTWSAVLGLVEMVTAAQARAGSWRERGREELCLVGEV